MKASGSWRPAIDLSTLNLRVLKSRFKMETLQSVLVCAERRLDGVSGLEGRLLANSNPSGQPQVSQVRCLRTGVPVQGSMFWSLHGAASRHEGHGSGVDLSSSCGDQDSSLTQRLADPGSLSVSSCLSFGHCAGIVSELGDRSELGEVESSSISASGVLGSGSGFTVFQGFSFPAGSGEALVNWRRISVLCRAASVILARSFRSPVISDSRRSLQLLLHRSCECVDDSALVRWDVFCQRDLEWWLV